MVEPGAAAAVEEDRAAAVEGDRTAAVQGDRTAAVEGDRTAAVEEDRAAAVEGDRTAAVEADRPAAVEPYRSRILRLVAGRSIYFDAEGFFWDAADWSEPAAEELARETGIGRLDEIQWRIIRFLREFYEYHGRGPMNRELRSGTGLSLAELERAFPDGIKLGARRLAGLPNPKTCLD